LLELDFDLRKGRDGGESALDAADVALDSVVDSESPENIKYKKPTVRSVARRRVMGFVLRRARGAGMAQIVGGLEAASDNVVTCQRCGADLNGC
jgi:hypothetical protein